MSGNNKGFTLIEVLVVIAIIGILLATITPNFRRLLPRREREVFLSKLNALTRAAWQRALVERKIHRMTFNFEKKLITVEVASVTKDGQQEFQKIKGMYVPTSLKIPANIVV